MQLVKAKFARTLKEGERVICADSRGLVGLRVDAVVFDSDGYALRLCLADQEVELDQDSEVLIMGEWLSPSPYNT